MLENQNPQLPISHYSLELNLVNVELSYSSILVKSLCASAFTTLSLLGPFLDNDLMHVDLLFNNWCAPTSLLEATHWFPLYMSTINP